jgi:hypothetical protein
MRNLVAERILSLVTAQDRAGTILGDLLEGQPGSIGFWFSLLRMVISIGVHRPYRFLSNFLSFAIDIGGFALCIWVYTHVIGLSYLLTAVFLIPVELVFWFRRRRRSPQPRARRTF